MTRQLTALFVGISLLAGCAEKAPKPRSVTEFVDNPLLLEAAVVRCARDRAESRYDPECINAREAVDIVQAKEEALRRAELEERSERKRRALRRTQQAAAEARRRAEEAERLRKEAAYLAQFGALPSPGGEADTGAKLPEGNVSIAVVPKESRDGQPATAYGDVLPATDGGNAPVAVPAPEEEPDG